VRFEERLKDEARRLGFDKVGIAAANEADDFARFTAWLGQGFAGEMTYLEKHAAARRHPGSILEGVKSVVMTATVYQGERETTSKTGGVARYARNGRDYHEVLWERLDKLLDWVKVEKPGSQGRGVVDTAPLLERDFARRAGLGWIGKNTMLLDKFLGSYFFLGALLLDCELTPDSPHFASHCGTCTACLDACPTDAFTGPGSLDARKCISYLTIELKGHIPEEQREGVGEWLFGCDVCQEVCPWNRDAPRTTDPAFQVGVEVEPMELLSLTEEEFRRRFRHTALWRSRRRGLLRNAAIVLGNRRDRAAITVLEKALDDPEEVVREAVQWALRKIMYG
jgi:epoxyqueuosine reductase